VLFQIDLAGIDAHVALLQFWDDHEAEPDERAFAERLVLGVRGQRVELDRWIVGSAQNWRIERMAVVDRNVLRLAVLELLDEVDTPAAVVIDEAIAVAKRFGSGDSGAFVNGVLDSIRLRLEKERAGQPSAREA
jgi:N utilization substance protein B